MTVALRMEGVRFVRQGRPILDGIDWSVRSDERWVVLGPNGSGKTTMVRLMSLYERPSEGTLEVLGGVLGRIDVRRHRERIGLTSAALADQLRRTLTAAEIVVCARHAALEPWWHEYTPADWERAGALLAQVGCAEYAEREFATLSSGEKQRVLLARTLMGNPGLIVLDEPAAGMDLGGREQLVTTLDALGSNAAGPPMVLVTHHLEEIPPSFDHALLLRDGAIVSQGPIGEVLTSELVSATFDVAVDVASDQGRWRIVPTRRT